MSDDRSCAGAVSVQIDERVAAKKAAAPSHEVEGCVADSLHEQRNGIEQKRELVHPAVVITRHCHTEKNSQHRSIHPPPASPALELKHKLGENPSHPQRLILHADMSVSGKRVINITCNNPIITL